MSLIHVFRDHVGPAGAAVLAANSASPLGWLLIELSVALRGSHATKARDAGPLVLARHAVNLIRRARVPAPRIIPHMIPHMIMPCPIVRSCNPKVLPATAERRTTVLQRLPCGATASSGKVQNAQRSWPA